MKTVGPSSPLRNLRLKATGGSELWLHVGRPILLSELPVSCGMPMGVFSTHSCNCPVSRRVIAQTNAVSPGTLRAHCHERKPIQHMLTLFLRSSLLGFLAR